MHRLCKAEVLKLRVPPRSTTPRSHWSLVGRATSYRKIVISIRPFPWTCLNIYIYTYIMTNSKDWVSILQHTHICIYTCIHAWNGTSWLHTLSDASRPDRHYAAGATSTLRLCASEVTSSQVVWPRRNAAWCGTPPSRLEVAHRETVEPLQALLF